MILLAIPSLLVGAVLAQHFRVMVLLPATAMVLIAAAGTGLTQSYTIGWTMLMAAAASASMQVGYLLGLALRCLPEAQSTESPHRVRASASARQPAETTPLTWGPPDSALPRTALAARRADSRTSQS